MNACTSPDLLGGARWECAVAEPADEPGATPSAADPRLVWFPAQVPGTAAGAVRALGDRAPESARRAAMDPDSVAWWYRTTLPALPTGIEAGPALLQFAGLATVADVWLDGVHLLHSENMFVAREREVAVAGGEQFRLLFAALMPLLGVRRPRAPWKTRLLRHAGLRWWRTTALGRMPELAPDAAPVGPWRPVRLVPLPAVRVIHRQLRADVGAGAADGRLVVGLKLGGPAAAVLVGEPATVRVELLGGSSILEVETLPTRAPDAAECQLDADLAVPDVQRWWPAGYGQQPRYAVTVEVAGTTIELGTVGFRSLSAERGDGGFRIVVNGQSIFARGALWNPPDRVTLMSDRADVLARLQLVVDAGLVMLRIPGTTVYPDEHFLDLCDELSILLWQDLMVANLPPPDHPGYLAELTAEIEDVLGRMQGRPSTAVVCGGSEVEQQAAMMGLEPARRAVPVLEHQVPTLVQQLLSGIPYLVSTPTGGDPPTRPDVGVAHWFGVGGCLLPLSSVRGAGVRFAAECLAFSNPPERYLVDAELGGAAAAGHAPRWKAGIPRDPGSGWDFEDVRDHYVRELFGTDPLVERRADPERALDLGRAAVAAAMATTMTEWRRPGSGCDGALVLALNDMTAGAGWGLLDINGQPKSVWYALRRVLAPLAVLLTGEGLAGIDVHVVNDSAAAVTGRLHVRLFLGGETVVEQAERELVVPANGAVTVGVEELLGGFRDVGHTYVFGPPVCDVIVATLLGADGLAGTELASTVHLPLGLARPVERDLGLGAVVEPGPAPELPWMLRISTRVFAQSVVIDVPGYRPEDSWFDLPPGAERCVGLTRIGPDAAVPAPRGEVRALNAAHPSPVMGTRT